MDTEWEEGDNLKVLLPSVICLENRQRPGVLDCRGRLEVSYFICDNSRLRYVLFISETRMQKNVNRNPQILLET